MSGVYISYPFCAQKCSFCNFASGVFPAAAQSRYHARLLEELRSHPWSWQPQTVYFGGGTPSLMPLNLLRECLLSLPATQDLGHAATPSSLIEVTLECAPGSVTPERAAAWAACGINRISLGVQSFVLAELRSTGRRHNAETVRNDIRLLRDSGIDNINIDLIAGLPEQTLESWQQSLDWMERLAPPHVSVYIFEIDHDSRLGSEILAGGARYRANRLPDDDLTAELYERAVERLSALSLERYEISNFALPGRESRHNLKYWQLEPYLGFGLDAHSFDGTRRWSNPDSLDLYLESPRSSDPVTTDPAEEHFFVGLRLMRGIVPSPREWTRFALPIQKHLQTGMLVREGNRLRLSDRGVLLSNDIFQEFVHV